jgi:DNA modification methylase
MEPKTFTSVRGNTAKLYHGDSLAILRSMIGYEKPDVVFTDPPYEHHHMGGGGCFQESDGKIRGEGLADIIDSYDMDAYFDVWMKLGAKHVWCFCSNEQIDQTILQMRKHKLMHSTFLWFKFNGPPRVNNTWWNGDCEYAIHGRLKGAPFNNGVPLKDKSHVMEHPMATENDYNGKPEAGFHPTAKPVAIITPKLNVIAQPGHTILDPFMGSGAVGEAALRLGMNFIGIEKKDEYFNLASRRLELVASQRGMF